MGNPDKMIEYKSFITREYIREHPEKIFLFGDDLLHKGYGGQAKEMRGEPNSFGIPTKKNPTMNSSAFFTDNEFLENARVIDESFVNIRTKIPEFNLKKDVVVIPKAGIGTGFAKLQEKAPMTYGFLLGRLKEFGDVINV